MKCDPNKSRSAQRPPAPFHRPPPGTPSHVATQRPARVGRCFVPAPQGSRVDLVQQVLASNNEQVAPPDMVSQVSLRPSCAISQRRCTALAETGGAWVVESCGRRVCRCWSCAGLSPPIDYAAALRRTADFQPGIVWQVAGSESSTTPQNKAAAPSNKFRGVTWNKASSKWLAQITTR